MAGVEFGGRTSDVESRVPTCTDLDASLGSGPSRDIGYVNSDKGAGRDSGSGDVDAVLGTSGSDTASRDKESILGAGSGDRAVGEVETTGCDRTGGLSDGGGGNGSSVPSDSARGGVLDQGTRRGKINW